jgi:hypothetical protein
MLKFDEYAFLHKAKFHSAIIVISILKNSSTKYFCLCVF